MTKIFTFFAFSLENIWSIQKKVVILQAFSRERDLMGAYVYNKSMENFEEIIAPQKGGREYLVKQIKLKQQNAYNSTIS